MPSWPNGLPIAAGALVDGTLVGAAAFYTNITQPIDESMFALWGDQRWHVPGLTGGWVTYDNGAVLQFHGYRIWGAPGQEKRIVLRGLVKNGSTGSGNPIFTLPSGYRPSGLMHFMAHSNGALAQLDIDTSGRVYVTSYLTGGSNAFVSLAGVNFIGT